MQFRVNTWANLIIHLRSHLGFSMMIKNNYCYLFGHQELEIRTGTGQSPVEDRHERHHHQNVVFYLLPWDGTVQGEHQISMATALDSIT